MREEGSVGLRGITGVRDGDRGGGGQTREGLIDTGWTVMTTQPHQTTAQAHAPMRAHVSSRTNV